MLMNCADEPLDRLEVVRVHCADGAVAVAAIHTAEVPISMAWITGMSPSLPLRRWYTLSGHTYMKALYSETVVRLLCLIHSPSLMDRTVLGCAYLLFSATGWLLIPGRLHENIDPVMYTRPSIAPQSLYHSVELLICICAVVRS